MKIIIICIYLFRTSEGSEGNALLTPCYWLCQDNKPEGYGYMKRQTERLIKEMVQRIVAGFNPEKVILFGSYARGTAGTDSDVDLLVVMRVRGSKRKIQLRIRTALHDILLPKDVIVSDVAEFDWRKDVVGTIEWPAAHEGKVLYAKS